METNRKASLSLVVTAVVSLALGLSLGWYGAKGSLPIPSSASSYRQGIRLYRDIQGPWKVVDSYSDVTRVVFKRNSIILESAQYGPVEFPVVQESPQWYEEAQESLGSRSFCRVVHTVVDKCLIEWLQVVEYPDDPLTGTTRTLRVTLRTRPRIDGYQQEDPDLYLWRAP